MWVHVIGLCVYRLQTCPNVILRFVTTFSPSCCCQTCCAGSGGVKGEVCREWKQKQLGLWHQTVNCATNSNNQLICVLRYHSKHFNLKENTPASNNGNQSASITTEHRKNPVRPENSRIYFHVSTDRAADVTLQRTDKVLSGHPVQTPLTMTPPFLT